MERVFLGWDRPGLAAAVDWLVRRFGTPGTLDLQRAIVAVPGSRAGRRLVGLLVHRAEEDRLLLTPPKVLTVGRLPEQLYRAKRPFADDLVQHLAWVAALRRTDPASLRNVVPSPPAQDDLGAWLPLAETLGRLHRELAAEAQNFAYVAHCGSNLPGFREAQRWQTLAEVQDRYLRKLDGVGLWDLQTARLVAIRSAECATVHEIVLVGAVDLNRAQQLMLDQVAPRVTALVVAPETLAERFDEYGCLRPKAWQDVEISLRPEQIEIAEGPAEQAAAVVRALAALGARYSGEDITVGVPDEELVPYLEQRLGHSGVAVRYGVGTPVRRLGPCRLLEAAADYLDGRRFSDFASLVRHPAIEAWLARGGLGPEGDRLTELDEYQGCHLPYRVSGRWLGPQGGTSELRRMYEAVERLLAGLGGAKRPLAQWGEPLAVMFTDLFGDQPLDPGEESDRTVLETCDAVCGVLRGFAEIPEELMPSLGAEEALRLVLQQLDAALTTTPAMPGAVELLGWLELTLDDAPVLVVTGMNEGIVPASVNADLFLPNQLRLALGIEDNDRRYARDAYALSVLAASRKELKLIAGRRNAQKEPLLPSRLLFTCDRETIACRVQAFFASEGSAQTIERRPSTPPLARPGRGAGGEGRQGQETLAVPLPQPLPRPVDSMRVTEFRDFLACPYRYYLRHRLGLEAAADDAEELDGMAFGSLAHEVFRAFGSGRAAASTDAEEVFAQLNDALDQRVRSEFGGDSLAAVLVQVEQLRGRLKAFARWQAQWAAQGWRIRYVEVGEDRARAAIAVDGREMALRGRIDRIDFHSETGRWVIFDYKTADAGQTPEQTHVKAGQWVDLQLPLYRHLAKPLGVGGDVKLGFIVLPKDPARVGERLAEWSEEDLQSADRAAEEVIRKVWAGAFWPPTSPSPPGFEDLAAICQEGQFASAFSGTGEEGDAP